MPGGLSDTARPDPIPNSVVKRISGDDNEAVGLCENTSLPDLLKPTLKVGFFMASQYTQFPQERGYASFPMQIVKVGFFFNSYFYLLSFNPVLCIIQKSLKESRK